MANQPDFFKAASDFGEVSILVHFSSNEEEPVWQPYLTFSEENVKFLTSYGSNKVGFYVHAMICALGVWGYLEKGINKDEWRVARNEDEVTVGLVFRFIAKLNTSAMIPGTDLGPKRLGTGVQSSAESSAESGLSSPSTENSSPRAQSPSSVKWTVQYLNAEDAPETSFRPRIMIRDRAKCVMTGTAEDLCQAAHLINRFNSSEVIDSIVHHRNHLGGENKPFWRKVQGPHDVRLGLFLSIPLHDAMDKFHLGPYRVPNFGMRSLTEPADNIHINHVNRPSVVPVTVPDKPPTTLTAEALNEEIAAPAEWAGTNSQVFLVPLNHTARLYVEARVTEQNHYLQPEVQSIHTPDADKGDQWPPNLCFDWAWGGRILKTFGTREALKYAQRSPLGAMVQDCRLKHEAKQLIDEDTPIKSRRNTNLSREILGATYSTSNDRTEAWVINADIALGRNAHEVTRAVATAAEIRERVHRLD